ncbi:TonB-dependent receptor [Sphingobium phenoxybenzoativorans]|uniref:TonB-dependent receptor n=1 Tax=Sphingobium phenoxybenzoativorans TaxID=1592790 RepID=A0A975K5T5_9SPHN|nr:TonB-dependent receptor [Sphingobium phenoxybenzoativorans]QUT04623.1 TonB-dependent receptor [Sphingobium phenoxybenzoativorans]
MNMKGTRKLWLAGASLAAIVTPGTAFAQAGEEGAQSSGGIEDIVVTAQKRSENLQKTPAAVTALSPEVLTQAGVTDLRSVQALVPAARFQPEGNTTQVFLRGIGSNLDFASIEQSVSFNFNGIYIPREGTSAPLYDLERIEALPGPQGTLYGRSAIGGTVNVSFARPKHKTEISGVLEAGNYSLLHGTVVGNAPLTDTLAIRLAVDYIYHKGYMETGSDSKDTISARIGLLYEPNSDVSIYWWGYTAHKYGSTPNLVNKGLDPNTFTFSENAFLRDRPWDDLRPGALAGTAPFGQPTRSEQNYRNWVTGAEVNFNLSDDVKLTYIPGYFFLHSEVEPYWLGVIPAYKLDRYKEITQELRLSGNSGKLDWLLGLYGYRVTGRGQGRVLINTPLEFFSSNVLSNKLEGAAIFGQGTYSISDPLRVTIGGRLGTDRRRANGISLEDQVTPYAFRNTYKRFDYKVGVEFDVAPQIMLYATYQTGYQPGTYNETFATPTQTNAVKTATLDAISGGFKARFFDNKLQINNEVFFYTYKDLFMQQYDASKAYNQIFNAAKVTIPGNELDIVFQPTRDDQLKLNVSYIKARNKDFITPAGDNYNGFSTPYAADWTISGGYYHDFHFGSGYLRAQGDARYESSFWSDFVHTPGVRQKAYVKANANITYYADNGGWSFGAWIKNITNEAVIAATAAAGIPGPATAYLEAPRTYGVRGTFNF